MCLCFAAVVQVVVPAPASGFVFPEERRREKKLEPIITPPVLPVLEHLERDPSTLLPGERRAPVQQVKPRFGFGGGFNVAPSNGGLTASISSSANGAGASQAASQSFSFGFNEGFSASHSASQAASFNGFGSGSQASSQAASFNGGSGTSVSGAASSASAFGGGSASQSASSAFGFNNNGFNTLNGFQPPDTSGTEEYPTSPSRSFPRASTPLPSEAQDRQPEAEKAS
ncbi:Uncharacterized protein OBRU01_11137 [Operophtera brumata]|uniref:Uncharacterized protein n=1 Tax=Operophtera brumata TaxID=104452 RepID=A0A0L7LCH8_OPEBR|nr:Uncharacterized protein OBRU01_11137 [Operophtera brumata]